MSHQDIVLFGRVGLAFVLCFAVGFERELRGSPAGDRTFSLVGTAAAAVSAVTVGPAPQAIGGVITGVGFIGAGFVLRSERGMIRGMTSAAALFAATGIGVVAGTGHPWLAVFVSLLTVLDLELRSVPLLRRFDARRFADAPDDDTGDPGGDGFGG
ncbi:MAG TPA: MgtC/SapB family protein [Acidimicrobiia bacterium]|nr:MgtC/SapB family protein [Acidimicrobiia bacterium]